MAAGAGCGPFHPCNRRKLRGEHYGADSDRDVAQRRNGHGKGWCSSGGYVTLRGLFANTALHLDLIGI